MRHHPIDRGMMLYAEARIFPARGETCGGSHQFLSEIVNGWSDRLIDLLYGGPRSRSIFECRPGQWDQFSWDSGLD
jgi:hypothetical protein